MSNETPGPEAAGITVDTRTEPDGAVVCRFAGDLDLDSVPTARAALEEGVRTGPPVLVVDLEEVAFCDSSGLNLLIRTRLAAQEAAVDLRIGPLSAPVERLLEITGATEIFQLHTSTAEALAAARAVPEADPR
ncbi:STAS domain-containing protein [Kitasatospora sp. CMC57]|uniref:Anti-sigma factor antagonist n=1 Tax=Kitasatospora sp. CMC57 TaxID=3231513 RepID=A0AB33JVA2_9ACTN